MKLKYEFVKREIAGDTFLVPIGEGAKKFSGLFALNELAAFIWDKLPEAADDNDVVDMILEEYDVSREEAAEDVGEVLSQLRGMGVIE